MREHPRRIRSLVNALKLPIEWLEVNVVDHRYVVMVDISGRSSKRLLIECPCAPVYEPDEIITRDTIDL